MSGSLLLLSGITDSSNQRRRSAMCALLVHCMLHFEFSISDLLSVFGLSELHASVLLVTFQDIQGDGVG